MIPFLVLLLLLAWVVVCDDHILPIETLSKGKRDYGVQCQECGEDGLHWSTINGKYHLFLANDLHRCNLPAGLRLNDCAPTNSYILAGGRELDKLAREVTSDEKVQDWERLCRDCGL